MTTKHNKKRNVGIIYELFLKHMSHHLINGNIATPFPYIGIVKGRLNIKSGLERSVIQSINGTPLNSIVDLKTTNKAIKRGICNSMGKHPPRGLILCFLYNAIVSLFSLPGSDLYLA